MICETRCFTVRTTFNSDQIINTCQYGEYMMSKNNENIGAVADSVSSDNVNVEVINANETAEFETITVPACCPDTGEIINETVVLTPDQIEWARKFITDFTKEYRKHPECPAAVLHSVMWDIRQDLLLAKDHAEMDDKKIVADAHKLVNTGCKLLHDYSKFHDEANDSIKSLVREHAPYLQNGLDKIQKQLLEDK